MRMIFLILLISIINAEEDFFSLKNRLFCERANPIDEIGDKSGIGEQRLKNEILKHVEFQKKLFGAPAMEVLADTFIPMIGGKAYYISSQRTIETANCKSLESVKVFKITDSSFCSKDILVEIGPQQTAYMTRKGIVR